MTRRRPMSATRRARIFAAHEGVCHLCGFKIDGTHERWEVEHIIALEMGGEDEDENCAPAHVACHQQKTKADLAAIAKAKRMEQRAIGIRRTVRNPLPGSRGSPWKAKIGGGWVRRDEE